MGETKRRIPGHYGDRLELFSTLQEGDVDALFLGDSLTERYDLDSYFPNLTTANRGIDGDTVFGLLHRLDESIAGVNPRVIVMLIGVNDVDAAPSQYPELLLEVRKRFPSIPLLCLSLLPVGGIYSDMNADILKANEIIREEAETIGANYVDVHPCLCDDSGELCEDCTVDGVHLSPEGYRRLTLAIQPYLSRLLGR